MARLCVVSAMTLNRVIGRDNDLPWRMRADMLRFLRLTRGQPVIMGRLTFESIDRVPLKGRRNIVLTRDESYRPAGVEVARSLDEALGLAAEAEQVWAIGGHGVYAAALPRADRLCLTVIHAELEGDSTFPSFDTAGFTVAAVERLPADDENDYAQTYWDLVRAGVGAPAPRDFPRGAL